MLLSEHILAEPGPNVLNGNGQQGGMQEHDACADLPQGTGLITSLLQQIPPYDHSQGSVDHNITFETMVS